MKLSDYTGQPCRSKMAFEFVPHHNVRIDLEKAVTDIGTAAKIEIQTKVLLILIVEDTTVSLYPSGKILVRGEKDMAKSRAIAEKIISRLTSSVHE